MSKIFEVQFKNALSFKTLIDVLTSVTQNTILSFEKEAYDETITTDTLFIKNTLGLENYTMKISIINTSITMFTSVLSDAQQFIVSNCKLPKINLGINLNMLYDLLILNDNDILKLYTRGRTSP